MSEKGGTSSILIRNGLYSYHIILVILECFRWILSLKNIFAILSPNSSSASTQPPPSPRAPSSSRPCRAGPLGWPQPGGGVFTWGLPAALPSKPEILGIPNLQGFSWKKNGGSLKKQGRTSSAMPVPAPRCLEVDVPIAHHCTNMFLKRVITPQSL